ncbi:ABC transporter transmembrane domain-containing protein [Aestuariispira insulae]|uniref:ABC transporter transmembrane protein n=1 Tax=Aestuariispira insulae TaxID=1461337 RepID=A0A3D9HS02_9PROT|nr:ABC transporter transmembrane domain-containing protein [Aestuariispira insulae]RED52277.1 ABC transporter transmembrane protein [Aestuariispira insulae]
MERSLFKFIWRYSKTQQIATLLLIAISLPFLYLSLDLPKTIVNKAIGGEGGTYQLFQLDFLGPEPFLDIPLEQLEYLFTLCGLFLALVCINGAFKYRINVLKGVMGERMLRRIRYMLLERSLRFPLPHFQKLSSGEIVTMVNAEVEPLAGFFGDAFALLAFQGGTFLTLMVFMFVQDPLLGLAAFISIPVQGYVIPKLQMKINLLAKERVLQVRLLSNRINEVIGGVEDVHAHDHSKYALAELSRRLGKIFWIRFEIYNRKFFMKFLNNFIGQMTPFFFYSIGGYLVIQGELTFGALVAVLAAYKDLAAPWKELLNYYQRLADSRIKYEQLHAQFVPEGMMSADKLLASPEEVPHLDGDVEVNGLSYVDEDGLRLIDNISFRMEAQSTTMLTCVSGSSRDIIARLMARLLTPSRGSITSNGIKFSDLNEAVTGQRIGFLSSSPAFFNKPIADNLFMGISQSIPEEEDDDPERRKEREEAEASGNSLHNDQLDWTNYALAGQPGYEELRHHTVDLLKSVELDVDFFELGLRQTANPEKNPLLAENVLTARNKIRRYLDERGMSDLVRNYDFLSYNDYTTVAENILFARPITDDFKTENLASNPIITGLLDEFGLTDEFINIGKLCAETMVEMFSDIPAGHPFFEQFSFVDEDSLPDLKLMVGKANKDGIASLSDDQRRALMGLPFKLTPQRHRLGLIDNRTQTRLLAVRRALHERHTDLIGTSLQLFDTGKYNDGLSIQENILFGCIAYGRADANQLILSALTEVCDELDLREAVIRTAFNFEVGIGGARLNAAQRQKLALVRNILKKPDILIINDGLNALDGEAQKRIAGRLPELFDASILWIASTVVPGLSYSQHLELTGGQIKSADEAADRQKQEADEPEAAQDTSAMNDEAQILKTLPLFSELEANRLKLLAFTAEKVSYKPGEIMVRQGDDGDAAYVILDGEADVVLEGENGQDTVLFQLGRAKIVGELALLCDTPRTATIRAVSNLKALKLNKEVFGEMARHDANFAFQMTKDLSQRLVNTTEELNAVRGGD